MLVRSFFTRFVGLSCLPLVLLACGDDAPAEDGAGAGDGSTSTSSAASSGAGGEGGTGGSMPAELVFAPCPVHSDGSGQGAACATVAVPARWSDPAGPSIDLFVKRIGAADAPQQLWMLNGGPGASGSDFEELAEYLVSVDDRLAIFLPDHRGTGRSTRLGCATEEADASPDGIVISEEEWPACLASVQATFGNVLDGFTTTNAAHDVAWLVERTRGPGQRAVVWGGSYGTRWVQRYIHLYPEQADGLSMTGIVHPTKLFSDYDEKYDEVGDRYLDACSADPLCSAKLGPDAATRAHSILDMLDTGHCPEVVAAGLDRTSLQGLFAFWLLYAWEERVLAPAILYRIERCDADDIASLTYLGAALQAPATPDVHDRHHSTVLANHVGLSEFWPTPTPTLAELDAVADDAVFSIRLSSRLRRRLDGWPSYEPDSYYGTLGPTTKPMLMLQGELDPATTSDEAAVVGDFYQEPGQAYYLLPGAAHSFDTPTPSGSFCALTMFFQFALEPDEAVDDCTGDIVALDFAGDSTLANTYLATDDIWENLGATAAPQQRTAVEALESFRSARRR
jgi:pimeloyl-ACP methyl ester carboxylesterase